MKWSHSIPTNFNALSDRLSITCHNQHTIEPIHTPGTVEYTLTLYAVFRAGTTYLFLETSIMSKIAITVVFCAVPSFQVHGNISALSALISTRSHAFTATDVAWWTNVSILIVSQITDTYFVDILGVRRTSHTCAVDAIEARNARTMSPNPSFICGAIFALSFNEIFSRYRAVA